MDDKVAAKIARSPQAPGVYLLQDREGGVLYVGKSINLRKRLLQWGLPGKFVLDFEPFPSLY